MDTKLIAIACALLLAGCAKECTTGSLEEATSKDLWKALGVSWSARAMECRVAGYLVAGPAAEPNGDLVVIKDGRAVVNIGAANEITVVSTSGIALTVQDRDKDGEFDFVSYKTATHEGSSSIEVTDGDMDGRPDMRLSGGQASIDIDGHWYPLERHHDREGVLVGGEWRAVSRAGWHWELASQ